MHTRKTNLAPSINEGYESDVDVINDGRRLSAEISSILSSKDSFSDEHGSTKSFTATIPTALSSSRNAMSHDNLSKAHLTGIPEEVRRDFSRDSTEYIADTNQLVKEKGHTNLGYQNMSLSNFKMVHGALDKENDNDAMNREASHASIIQMKEINTDSSLPTGRNFRKLSAFLITPRDNKTVLDVDEKVNIKIIDKPNVPELFVQLNQLKINPTSNNYYWMEACRWLKFEEDYNSELEHFNYAHLSPLSIQSVTNFRKLFSSGDVLLDIQGDNYANVLKTVLDSLHRSEVFSESELHAIRNALVLRHCNIGDPSGFYFNDAPLFLYDDENKCFIKHVNVPMSHKRNSVSALRLEGFNRILSHSRLEGRLEPGTESLSVQIGALDALEHAFSVFIRLDPPVHMEELTEVSCPLRFLFIVFGPKSKEREMYDVGRCFSAMMSNIEYREIGYSANNKEELLEAIKTFIEHSVLISPNKIMTHDTLAAMLPQMKHYFNGFIAEKNQKIFEEMKKEMLIKEQEITQGPTSDIRQRRISVMSTVLDQHYLKQPEEPKDPRGPDETVYETIPNMKVNKARKVFMQFCPPLRYFIHDWRGFKKRFISDYKDAFTKENAPIVFIGIIFIYFVVMTPAITFGALLNAVNPKMTITMMLLASGFFQLFNTLFGGQPFDVVGITGPIFAAEKTLAALAVMLAMDLGSMRLWIGVYVAILGIFFTIFNGVVIIRHIRRSVEEIYNFLVAAIYALSAIFNMFIPLQYAPVTVPFANGSNIDVIASERLKLGVGGTTLFLAFFMANFCLILVGIKKGTFFRRKIRRLLGSLNVPLGIVLIIVLTRIFFMSYNLPTLNVPPSNSVNFTLWFNVPTLENVMNVNTQGHGFCFLISLSIFSTITCEVSCNGIMTSKSERKLLKPSLFSLNLFNAQVIFPLISGILGWPFISGGTVRSHIHCLSMSIWSVRLPGVPPKVIGAAEQRISGSIVGLLVFLSVFLGSALQLIPMAALYGMFLYMGIMGAIELVFIRRFINILRRRKYWNNHDFLKDYPTWNIMTLVLTQFAFVGILMLLNCVQQFTSLSWTPLLYAPTIGLFALVRGYILPRSKRLNTHLSKMDKKHPVKLYADLRSVEQVIVTIDNTGVNMEVIQSEPVDVAAGTPEESESDNESR